MLREGIRSLLDHIDLGDGIVGHVRSSVSQNSGFDEDSVFIDVYELYNPVPFDYACPALTFQADLRASGGGAMTGPGVFCAPPPTADGYNYHVACYEGTRNGVSVSSAAMSCLTDLYFLEPTQISGGDLQLIERGTNGILGMYRAVAGTAQAAGAFGLAVAAETAQQQF